MIVPITVYFVVGTLSSIVFPLMFASASTNYLAVTSYTEIETVAGMLIKHSEGQKEQSPGELLASFAFTGTTLIRFYAWQLTSHLFYA